MQTQMYSQPQPISLITAFDIWCHCYQGLPKAVMQQLVVTCNMEQYPISQKNYKCNKKFIVYLLLQTLI